jgi:hypothetical protein
LSVDTAIAPHVRNLRRRLVAVRRKRTAVTVLTGLALALLVVLAALTAECALDWLTELPWPMRALILLGTLAGAGFFLRRDVVKPMRHQLNDAAVALLIERALPVFQSRFISSIQLAADQSHSASFIRALLAETDAMAATLSFGRVVRVAGLRRALLGAFCAVAAAGALAWRAGEATPILLMRAALLNTPLPRKTQITNLTGSRKIGIGEDLKIEAVAGGIIPSRGVIIATLAHGQKREYALEPEPDQHAHFSALIRSPQESFSYVIKLNDATSPDAEVTTLLRPVVVQLTCVENLPAYLKLPPVTRAPGDLRLLAGSRLSVSVRGSSPLSKASLRLTGVNREVPLQINPKTWRGQGELDIRANDLTGFSIRLVDTAGIESGASATYRIDVVPDQEPTVRMTYPTRREELATTAATVRIAFEAKDDFGLSRATLHYTLGTQAEKKIAFELTGPAAKTLARRFDWKLPSLKPAPQIGDVLEFWISVADNNTVTGPGVGASEHFQIRVVTEDEKRLDLSNRLSDTMGGLGEVAGSQEQLNKILGEAIFAKPTDSP